MAQQKQSVYMFQSHAGSIEAAPFHLACGNLNKGFNPTLVRLRRWEAWGTTWGFSSFQSHAGSIEAGSTRRAGRRGSSVSIPRWFD